MLEKADIRLNGSQPWDIQVHNEKLFERVVRQGTLGRGEAYMDGWWDCPQLDEMFYRAIVARLEEKVTHTFPVWLITAKQISSIFRI